MTLPKDAVSLGRMVIVPFLPFEWLLIWWCLRFWDLFPKFSAKRAVAWLASCFAYPGAVIAQPLLYKWITQNPYPMRDDFLLLILVGGNVISGLIAFGILHARRKKTLGAQCEHE